MKPLLYNLAAAAVAFTALAAVHTSAHAADYDQCFEGRNGLSYRRCLNGAVAAYALCIGQGNRPLRCRLALRRTKAQCRTRFCVITAPVRRSR